MSVKYGTVLIFGELKHVISIETICSHTFPNSSLVMKLLNGALSLHLHACLSASNPYGQRCIKKKERKINYKRENEFQKHLLELNLWNVIDLIGSETEFFPLVMQMLKYKTLKSILRPCCFYSFFFPSYNSKLQRQYWK